MTLVLLLILAAGSCPARAPALGMPGQVAAVKLPAQSAMRENAEGKKLYREEDFAKARERYRAALAADPDFLDARLNLACAFSREGRFREAAGEAVKLIRSAYVPWQREVREATDLGILQDQKDWARVVQAMSSEATAWGGVVGKSVLFVARTRPPINVSGEGVLVLRLNQEIFAWNPETGRYLQVTSEDGHVLGFARSADGRRVAYLLGGKLVREPGHPEVFRDLSLRVLEIATMSLGRNFPISAEASQVELRFFVTPEILVTGPRSESTGLRLGESGWEKIPALRSSANLAAVILSPAGVQSEDSRVKRAACAFDLASKPDRNGIPQLEVRGRGGAAFTLDAHYGAGLPGLPFPTGSPTAPPPRESVKRDKK